MWAMGYMGNGVQGYRPHSTMGPMGDLLPKYQKDVKKMSSCQKDVKCQKFKHLDYGGGSRKNLIDTMRFTDIDVNFDITNDGH